MGTSPIRIRLLGGLAIERGAEPSRPALSGRRSELVFAYLVAEHRRTVSRDELADTLWPGVLPDSWAAAVRGVVTEVRRALQDAGLHAGETLLTERSGYRLRLPAGVVVDLDEARAGVAAARDALAAGAAAAAATAAARAAELAALPFLPHHEGDWVDGVREELDAIRSAALELQVRASLQAGDPRAAVEVGERLVRAEPFNEAANRLLIGALGAAGDRAGARRAYERCRAVLAAELGVEPSPETVAVFERALAGTAAPALAGTAVKPVRERPEPAGLSVLVVEDHAFQRRTALTLLRGLGVQRLAEAADGLAALALLADNTAAPDVIVCDIDMPGMDGVEFVRQVAARGLASAVAIASALEPRLLRAIQSVCEGYGLQVLGTAEKPLTSRRLGELLAAYRPPPPRAAGGDEALAAALAAGSLTATFEPIVDLVRGVVGAAQAAASLPVGDLRVVSDAVALTDRMLELACAQLAALDAAGLALDLWVALPGAALADPALAERLAERARGEGADPRRIVCAVDARVLRGDAALDVLTRLRVKGFGLCGDRVEGVPAEAELLARFPLTAARLDARLVAGPPGALQDAIDAARALDLAVVGAGCATADQFELLLALGCGHAQGPFFGGPVAAGRLAGHAARWRPPAAEDARR